MPRGGKRNSADGAYTPNRSDMQSTSQPIQAASGQAYGERKAQEDAQRAMPLQNGSGASVAPGAQAPGAPPLSPDDVPSLFGPSTRPDEPVTEGAALGAGAGPEALGATMSTEQQDIATILAPYVPTFEALAALPGASVATRNFARRLRGSS